MKRASAALLVAAACTAVGSPAARAESGSSGNPSASGFCDRTPTLTAGQQDRLLRFAAVVRDELEAHKERGVALISRSGLDLSRFRIRYSHAAVAWRGDNGAWSARQLYYACDERQPRLYDQGIAGFTMGIDDSSLGFVSIVWLPEEAGRSLREGALDSARALRLLASRYSANAYPFSVQYQNCNQWVAELMAVSWGDLPEGQDLRSRAQAWLREAHYAPEPVDVSRPLMLASLFVPLLHLSDHPESDQVDMRLQVSLPSTLEAFVRQRLPGSERVELCHDGRRVVARRGWTPIAEGCRAGPGDAIVSMDRQD